MAELSLPILDLSQLDDGPEAAARFRDDLRAATHDVGFFYLTGTGISPELEARLHQAALVAPAQQRLDARHPARRQLARAAHDSQAAHDEFLLLSQAIIFVLGWPLEWTEIIVIFIPIFLPLLAHFQIDPLLFGVLVFVNLQAAFLSPPVAMSAFYLKGVSPPHVTINQIFAGMMPYMLIVILCMVFMYIWPGLTLWLPQYLYGG